MIYVTDASRAVGVVSDLISEERREGYLGKTNAEYDRVREAFAKKQQQGRPRAAGDARARTRPRCRAPRSRGRRRGPASPPTTTCRCRTWSPTSTGRRSSRAGTCTDGSRPSCPTTWWGRRRPRLYDDAQEMLVRDRPGRAVAREGRRGAVPGQPRRRRRGGMGRGPQLSGIATLHTLRQQVEKKNGQPNYALSRLRRVEEDWIGGFCVTAGHGEQELVDRYTKKHRQLLRHHGLGAGRPLRRGRRRVAARAGAPRTLGLRGRPRPLAPRT